MRIGLLSDTHGWVHPSIEKLFSGCDEIWHAGDIGSQEVVEELAASKPLRAVYGNIDDAGLRRQFPEILRFKVEELDVLMTHIGGYPGRYEPGIKSTIFCNPPDLFISGHSHIAKVIPDTSLKLLHINPGSSGYNGFHQLMTVVRFTIEKAKILDLEMIELGERAKVSK